MVGTDLLKNEPTEEMKNGRMRIYPVITKSKRKPIRKEYAISEAATSGVIRSISVINKRTLNVLNINNTDRYVNEN